MIRSIIPAVIATLAVAGVLPGTIVHYSIDGHSYMDSYDGPANGMLTGGPFGGQTVASLAGSQYYLGAGGPQLHFTDANGFVSHYSMLTLAHVSTNTIATLDPFNTFGLHTGQTVYNNSNFLGFDGATLYMRDPDNTVSYYDRDTLLALGNRTWAAFSGLGELSGLSPARGVGLTDVSGNAALGNLAWYHLSANGTLEAYLLPNGGYYDLFFENQMFGGPLDGMALSSAVAPGGSQYGNYSVTFLGIGNPALGTYSLVFDVNDTAVPEPSFGVLMGFGLTAILLGRNIRRPGGKQL